MKPRIFPTSSVNEGYYRPAVRFDSPDERKRYDTNEKGFWNWCCTSTNGFTKLGLALAIIGLLLIVATAAIIPLIFILNYKTSSSGSANNSSSLLSVTIPKRLGIYYGWPSLVQGSNGNLTAAIGIFSQFDLVVFGDGIASPSHGDHVNTQTIIQALNTLGKLPYGYVDMGVTTQNLSILQMQTTVNNWTAMGVKGIMWDDAGYDYGVTRSRQTTMISYCHSLNLGVMMNAWNPDDVMSGTPMVLTSGDIYLLESYLISNGVYQNLTSWKTKADKCLSYSASLGISMACLSTSTNPIASSFGSTQQFSQAWFGTAIYGFNYFQATDIQYSASNNMLYAFSNPVSFYGNTWQTNYVQTDSSIHYYRSTDTNIINIYGNGASSGSGNLSSLSSG